MGRLSIHKVEYLGDKYFFESPELDSRLSIIEGPNGSGKSTFFNLIYYGLGGRVEEFDPSSREVHAEVMGDTNNLVRLVIGVDGELFTLTRLIRDNSITIFKPSTELDGVVAPLQSETLPLARRGDSRTFSDWLLEHLNIPVVDIFQGGKQFKLSFTDLARLIYYNQSPDANGIYKPADNTGYVSDSLEIRRAIFQILVGKTLLELYEAIGIQKIAERDAQAAKAVHDEYQDIVNHLLHASGLKGIQNTKALNDEMEAFERQIAQLLETRKAFSRGEIGDEEARRSLQVELQRVRDMELRRREIDEKHEQLVQEAGQLLDVERSLQADIQRINKVIYAHNQLNLFSADTCPYCLSSVLRSPGHCVCGCAIDERDYQRFFYSPAEYLEILKSKSKTLETLHVAIKSIQGESAQLRLERDGLLKDLSERRERITVAKAYPDTVDAAMEELDARLLEVRERLAKAQEAFRLETKLDAMAKRHAAKKRDYSLAKANVERLDGESKVELQQQVDLFNRVYNDLMTTVVRECRTASIDSQMYLPFINGGQYREFSASVPKRFLYYLTLLQLSLMSDIPFPRLLLVDTPETNGIDIDGLLKMLRQIETLENPKNRDFQILFSTGVGKYPPEFDKNVVLRLTDEDRLLKERSAV
ncbi:MULTISPECIES: AAA family ATPase [unclassified Caballeronia]|uniref:AAA family ATPase n=1 Tax=unclassified Caballeronia TaxID=2646786 RepID=UPI002028D823|nr:MULTISPECIES: AAA family ATPase [unclassified Caballeronia]